MALTKFDIASNALVMIGANPVASFASPVTAEEIACAHLYQTCVDHWLSLHPWRFATRTTQLARHPDKPSGIWQTAWREPADCKAVQNVVVGINGSDIEFDRFEDQIWCNATGTDPLYLIHTYEPPIVFWPGYFVALIEQALAAKFAFALSAKLDLRMDLEKGIDFYFRIAKNADSRQQTSRRFKLRGRRSIMEARLA